MMRFLSFEIRGRLARSARGQRWRRTKWGGGEGGWGFAPPSPAGFRSAPALSRETAGVTCTVDSAAACGRDLDLASGEGADSEELAASRAGWMLGRVGDGRRLRAARCGSRVRRRSAAGNGSTAGRRIDARGGGEQAFQACVML